MRSASARDRTVGAALLVALVAALAVWPHATPAAVAPAALGTTGTIVTTTEGLDAYGDQLGLDRVDRARDATRPNPDATPDPTTDVVPDDGSIAANDVRITELARSQGATLDAGTSVRVLAVHGDDLKIRVTRSFGSVWDGFVGWVSAHDVAAAMR